MRSVLLLGLAAAGTMLAITSAEAETVVVRAGESAVIYTVRGRECGGPAATFEWVAANTSNPRHGQLYDAGVVTGGSRSCGMNVRKRAVGFRSRKADGGKTVTVRFPHNERVTIQIK